MGNRMVLTDEDVNGHPGGRRHAHQNLRRGEIWHYRGTVAGRLLRGTTGTANKEIALRIIAETKPASGKVISMARQAVLTFAQAAMLYRAAEKPTGSFARWKTTGRTRPSGRSTPAQSGSRRSRSSRTRPGDAEPAGHRADAGDHQPRRRAWAVPHDPRRALPGHKKEKAPATWEWVQAFMAQASKPNLAALACFMFLTGARISQALAVTWEDVDFRPAVRSGRRRRATTIAGRTCRPAGRGDRQHPGERKGRCSNTRLGTTAAPQWDWRPARWH